PASAGHAAARHRTVPFDEDRTGAAVLIIDTGTAHSLADGGYARRHAECEAAAHKLGVAALSYAGGASIEHLDDPLLRARARHVHSENVRVRGFVAELVADTPSAERLGALLDASHASLRDDFAVSTAELDLAASAARRAGAFGARMVGAG